MALTNGEFLATGAWGKVLKIRFEDLEEMVGSRVAGLVPTFQLSVYGT